MCPMCLSAIAAYSAGSGGILVLARKVGAIAKRRQALPKEDPQRDSKVTDGGASHVGTNNDAQDWNT